MDKINLTIDTTNYRLQVDFLANDNTTVVGTHYIHAPWRRTDVTGTGWKFDNLTEDEFNKEVFFSQIVLLNAAPIGATTYAAVTALIIAMNKAASSGSFGGATDTPTMTTYSAGTTIASGAKSITIKTDSSFAGTILTDTALPDSVYTFTATHGNTLGAIAITRSAGSFTVLKIS